MMRKLLALALVLSVASAAVVPNPPAVCPQNNGRLLLSSAGIAPSPTFIPNTFTFQGNNQGIMGGTPIGPWWSIRDGQNSYFIENATLSAVFDIFSSPNRLPSELIGTGSMSSNNMQVVPSGGVNYFGGDITVTTNIPASPFPDASDAAHVNFRSRTTTFHFRPQREHPQDTNLPVIANVIRWSSHVQNQEAGVMTLWGGNGWNGQSFANQDAGFDLQLTFSCPNLPPVVVPCPPCSSPLSNFVVPSACIGRTIRHHSNENCITMSFVQSSDPSSSSGCGIPV